MEIGEKVKFELSGETYVGHIVVVNRWEDSVDIAFLKDGKECWYKHVPVTEIEYVKQEKEQV